jgi:hypothetical protein
MIYLALNSYIDFLEFFGGSLYFLSIYRIGKQFFFFLEILVFEFLFGGRGAWAPGDAGEARERV